MKYLLIIIIKFYKNSISPFLPSSCRFYPTCSEYAMQAIKIHGAFKGTFMATKRILRCNPFFSGGYDPVPGKHVHVHNHSEIKYDLTKYYEIL